MIQLPVNARACTVRNMTTTTSKSVVEILTHQHELIREGFIAVKGATGEDRVARFHELKAFLAAHETAEEMVLRPTTTLTAGAAVAEARNAEERESNRRLADLERLDPGTEAFETSFREFQHLVLAHADNEEREEFPFVERGRTQEQLEAMGRVLLAVEKIAPTHPHPSIAGSPTLQWATGPFFSVLDRARDALTAATR